MCYFLYIMHMYYVDVGLMTNRHATVMIPCYINKKMGRHSY